MPLPSVSIALFRHPEQPEQLWLACWNSRAQYFDFITAERLEGESWRECLDREIAWSLNLRRGKDYLISSMARLHLEPSGGADSTNPERTASTSVSHTSSAQPQGYASVEFYIVDLYGKTGQATLAQNDQLSWLSSEEVLAGRTVDGRNVSPVLVSLLKEADVIPRFRSQD